MRRAAERQAHYLGLPYIFAKTDVWGVISVSLNIRECGVICLDAYEWMEGRGDKYFYLVFLILNSNSINPTLLKNKNLPRSKDIK